MFYSSPKDALQEIAAQELYVTPRLLSDDGGTMTCLVTDGTGIGDFTKICGCG